jgi:hypothetical protein
MTRIVCLSVLAGSLLVSLGCSKSSQVSDGVEAKPTRIERATSITMGSARATARTGHDLARIFFELTAGQNVKELKLASEQQELIDTDGKSYKSNADLTFTFGSGGGTMSMDAMFEVPNTASLKTLKLGTASFDISAMPGAKPGADQR